jgi:hypothetical protein
MSEETPFPKELEPLLLLVGDWASDPVDIDTEKLDSSTPDELRDFVAAYDAVSQDALFGYLFGPASQEEEPSPEYLALTRLNVTVDEARARLA